MVNADEKLTELLNILSSEVIYVYEEWFLSQPERYRKWYFDQHTEIMNSLSSARGFIAELLSDKIINDIGEQWQKNDNFAKNQ